MTTWSQRETACQWFSQVGKSAIKTIIKSEHLLWAAGCHRGCRQSGSWLSPIHWLHQLATTNRSTKSSPNISIIIDFNMFWDCRRKPEYQQKVLKFSPCVYGGPFVVYLATSVVLFLSRVFVEQVMQRNSNPRKKKRNGKSSQTVNPPAGRVQRERRALIVWKHQSESFRVLLHDIPLSAAGWTYDKKPPR